MKTNEHGLILIENGGIRQFVTENELTRLTRSGWKVVEEGAAEEKAEAKTPRAPRGSAKTPPSIDPETTETPKVEGDPVPVVDGDTAPKEA